MGFESSLLLVLDCIEKRQKFEINDMNDTIYNMNRASVV